MFSERDEIFVMTTGSARARISMCFPWMSSRARNKLMHAIHGNGAGELTKTLQRNHALKVLDTALEDHTDGTFVLMETNADGACSVHAVSGSPSKKTDGTWELELDEARDKVGHWLSGGLQVVQQN